MPNFATAEVYGLRRPNTSRNARETGGTSSSGACAVDRTRGTSKREDRRVRDVTEALLAMLRAGRDGALATVIAARGSTPQVPGARLLLEADGTTIGTVGGGAIERLVIEALTDVKARGEPRVLACDLAKELGMCCGGSMEIFLEPVLAAQRLILFGAGHVAQPTAALARSVGFEVVVIDEREELNTAERFPGCRREPLDVETALRMLQPGDRDWLVIVTHDHRLDEQALRLALLGRARYIGLVGSRRKVYRLLERITAREGKLDLGRLYAPVGLGLGAVSPAEIAVSVVAELIALRHRVDVGSHLRVADDTRLATLLAECERTEPAADRGAARGVDVSDVDGDGRGARGLATLVVNDTTGPVHVARSKTGDAS
jgi:xanthine dehydrogenase accessory factor